VRQAAKVAETSPPVVASQEKRSRRVSDSNPFGEVRTWTDATGRHHIEAEFLELRDGAVQLKRTDGKTIVIALGKLSPEDQEIVSHPAAEMDRSEVRTVNRLDFPNGAGPMPDRSRQL
jgi:hypothetical protein